MVNPDDSVGAAPAGFDPFSEASLKYGAIEPGENPARVVDAPISTDGTNRVSRTARTAMEAEATPDAMVGDVAEDVMSGESGLTYIPITNTETTERARQAIERDGYTNNGDTYARAPENAFTIGTDVPVTRPPQWFSARHGRVHQPDECINVQYFLEAILHPAMIPKAVDRELDHLPSVYD